ncbi:hypothetical protein [Corynebacterium sp. sy039]|uniref:hypothetical protein n=1 Tax=Corynebacterium sp. sy039 TaxID=2599641 RepID=UPI0011B4E027|nr:hypothetical protein [Corynebacterium sp. sy039]QDZ43212.1 hypothetical protein FQV43_08635 [Corynebacterium sp. sy039]
MPSYRFHPEIKLKHWLIVLGAVVVAFALPAVINPFVPVIAGKNEAVMYRDSLSGWEFPIEDRNGKALECTATLSLSIGKQYDCPGAYITLTALGDVEDAERSLVRMLRAEGVPADSARENIVNSGDIYFTIPTRKVIGLLLENQDKYEGNAVFAVIRAKGKANKKAVQALFSVYDSFLKEAGESIPVATELDEELLITSLAGAYRECGCGAQLEDTQYPQELEELTDQQRNFEEELRHLDEVLGYRDEQEQEYESV